MTGLETRLPMRTRLREAVETGIKHAALYAVVEGSRPVFAAVNHVQSRLRQREMPGYGSVTHYD